MAMIAESRRKKAACAKTAFQSQRQAAGRIETTVSVMAYLKPRSATLVVYIPRNPGVPVVRTHRDVAKRILSGSRVRKRWQIGRTEGVSARVPFELVAPLLVGNKKLVAPSAVDPLFREAYRRSEEVREDYIQAGAGEDVQQQEGRRGLHQGVAKVGPRLRPPARRPGRQRSRQGQPLGGLERRWTEVRGASASLGVM
jgi:hypothetical protein